MRRLGLVCAFFAGMVQAATAQDGAGDLEHLKLYVCPFERDAGMFPVIEPPQTGPRLVGDWGEAEIKRFGAHLRIASQADILIINDDLTYAFVTDGRVHEGRCHLGTLQLGVAAVSLVDLLPMFAEVGQVLLAEDRVERAEQALHMAERRIELQSRQLEQLRLQLSAQAQLIDSLQEGLD